MAGQYKFMVILYFHFIKEKQQNYKQQCGMIFPDSSNIYITKLPNNQNFINFVKETLYKFKL